MREYKPGDKIKRWDSDHNQVVKGNIYNVKTIDRENLTLEEVSGEYHAPYFDLVESFKTKQELIFESL
jgi:hypothetical protein